MNHAAILLPKRLRASLLVAFLLVVAGFRAQAQTPGVGIGTTGVPDNSAALEVKSSSKGLLPPRLSQPQRDLIGSPAAGLVIFNTSTGKLNTWNGTSWEASLSSNEQAVTNATQTYTTPGQYSYTVPAGVTSMSILAVGAGGNDPGAGGAGAEAGGVGGRTQATLAVVPGQVLTVRVGGQGVRSGGNGGGGAVGGYNGGGSVAAYGGSGGGASDVRSGGTLYTNRVVVGGGGGGGAYASFGLGGNGGSATGVGADGQGGAVAARSTGATQAGPGTVNSNTDGTGGSTTASNYGGAGGGGYFGGGGNSPSSGGGGGSSWADPACTAVSYGVATARGNGSVTLTPGLGYAAPALNGANFVNVPGWTISGPDVYRASGSVGIGTTAPAASAVLDVTSTTKGLLPPRMNRAQRDAIASPATGLTIYNTTTNKVNTWNGTSWDASLTATEQPYPAQSTTFAYTGGPQTYTVPPGVTLLQVDAAGAAGATSSRGFVGGLGARAQATLNVTPGEVLTLYVGGTSYNGGGTGSANNTGTQGGMGGGASDVRRSAMAPSTALAERLLVAGGGGGGGGGDGVGGAGGAPNGATGGAAAGYVAGTGGTQSAGGSVGGALGLGGNSPAISLAGNSNAGGGGGGGYYGGGGASQYAGGGGGSSWVTPTGSASPVLTAGYRAGNGLIVLTPTPQYAAPALDGSNFVNVPGTYDNLGNHTATQNLNLGANTLVGNGGSTGLSISSGGSVGLGTSAPNTRLSISPGVIEPKITLWDGGAANATNHYGFGISGGQLNYHVDGTSSNHVFYAGGNNGNGTELLRIQGNGNVSTSGELRPQNANNRLRRANTPQQAVADVFDLAGLNGVHISNNEGEEGGFWANGNYAAIYSPGDNDLVKFLDEDGFDNAGTVYDGSALKARIDGNGQYFQVSDAKAKHDITPIADGLRKLTALSGYTYAFNLLPHEAEKGQTAQRAAGVLAQEVEKVLPEAVSEQDGHYMVNYAALMPLCIQAIKELKAENDALKAHAATAEAQAAAATEAFEARLRRLEAGEGQARQ